jgi:hypothetical protein
MATVLSLITTAALEMGLQVPVETSPATYPYNYNSKLTYQLYAVCRELRASRFFPQQKRTYSFTTSDGVASYAFPADFYSGLLGTQYDQSTSMQLVGPIDDGQWNYTLYGAGGNPGDVQYRVFGPSKDQYSSAKMMQLSPTPTDVRTISYEYITRSFFYPSGWTPSTTVYETITADTDICMFDDDIMISGLKYFYKEASDQPHEKDKSDFNRKLDNARARWVGSIRGTFGGGRSGRRYGPPTYRNWSL